MFLAEQLSIVSDAEQNPGTLMGQELLECFIVFSLLDGTLSRVPDACCFKFSLPNAQWDSNVRRPWIRWLSAHGSRRNSVVRIACRASCSHT